MVSIFSASLLSRELAEIKKELKKKSGSQDPWSITDGKLSLAEKELIQSIQSRTKQLNLNNITRTRAYYAFYRQYPHIKWALLGHLVSRNGGWNMTDLKGEFLSKLLTGKQQVQFFEFLERGNWLIFQDIYPQFLLYEESLRRQTQLFYLLRFLHVSTFMETMWSHFWTSKNQDLLTIALIINEQSYLDQRVIQNEYYQQTVLDTIHFQLQDVLALNQILFPYYSNAEETMAAGETKLLGHPLHHFASLDERIKLGKRLYSILMNNEKKLVQWADSKPHTGSRKDYWPHLFNSVKESLPGILYIPQTKNCSLKKNGRRIYSPELELAWKNVEHKEAEKGDWFKDWRIVDYFEDLQEMVDGAIKDEYCKTIERLELAVFTKNAIFDRKE